VVLVEAPVLDREERASDLARNRRDGNDDPLLGRETREKTAVAIEDFAGLRWLIGE